LLCNIAPEEQGMVKITGQMELKFFILNPGHQFQLITSQAHSVLLVGGTVHPVEHMSQTLFPSNSPELFSCGHVIQEENLLVLQMGKGVLGQAEFRFTHQQSQGLFKDLFHTIQLVCNSSPAGVVVFFPSYSFLESFLLPIKTSTVVGNKPLVFESRQPTSTVSPFAQFEQHIVNDPALGAVLFAVVGGKLSEGINFSDDLARTVVLVGLPYPNPSDLEFQEKMNFCKSNSGINLMESSCWKGVNQSIGRSIRHAKDYACVILLDARFAHHQYKLPKWMSNQFHPMTDWTLVQERMKQFFLTKG
jgi:chromosome transmission fidelity protein 1